MVWLLEVSTRAGRRGWPGASDNHTLSHRAFPHEDPCQKDLGASP